MKNYFKLIIFSIVFAIFGQIHIAYADVKITELEYDSVQAGTDTIYEWIELYNTGPTSVDLLNWTLTDNGANTTTLPSIIIPAGDFVLLANNPTNFQTNYPVITADIDLSPNLGLNNTAETLTLSDNTAAVIDFVAWEGGSAGWNLAATADAGESLCRTDISVDTDAPSDWQICTDPSPKRFGAPGGVGQDLALWLKADNGVTGSGSTLVWADQSGRDYDADITTGNPSEITEAINFNTTIEFDGDDYLTTSVSQDLGDRITAFYIQEATADNRVVFSHGNDILEQVSSATPFGNTIGYASGSTLNEVMGKLSYGERTLGGFTLETFGVTNPGVAGTLDGGNVPFVIGSDNVGTNPFIGRIPEIIVYDEDIDANSNLLNVVSYLALKYGITLSPGGPTGYYASDCSSFGCPAGTLMWDPVTTGVLYHNDVAGIGRDIASNLVQMKSRSSNADAMMTLEAVDSNNVDDLEFLSWGNDNVALNITNETDVPAGISSRLERQWISFEPNGDTGEMMVTMDLTQQTGLMDDPNLDYHFIFDVDTNLSDGLDLLGIYNAGEVTFTDPIMNVPHLGYASLGVAYPIEFGADSSDTEVSGMNTPSLLLKGNINTVQTIEVHDLGTGSAVEGLGNDYLFTSPQTITIPVGVYDGTSATAIPVTGLTILDNTFIDGNRTIDFDIQNPTSLVLGDANNDAVSDTDFTYTILDDDAPVPSSSGSGGSIKFTCKDPQANNYNNTNFGRHKQSFCKYDQEPTEDNPFNGNQCSEDKIVTNFMKNGDTDGRYSSYNKGIVTEIKLLQEHMNRLLLDDYGNQASGPVDGYFRSLTKRGVERLQQKLNQLLPDMTPLVIDGIVGPFTLKAINVSC